MSPTNIEQVIEQALAAARDATSKYLSEHGDRDSCGFAWCEIKPATSRVARVLKEKNLARKIYGSPGISVWNPSGNSTQAITAKERGAQAFRDVLQAAFPDLNVRACSRVD